VAFPYRTILCPVDFDENSLAALDKAVEIARQLKSSIVLVHVLPLIVALGDVPPPAALYEDQKKDAQAKLADITKQKLGGLKHEAHVFTGDVIASILAGQTHLFHELIRPYERSVFAMAFSFGGGNSGRSVQRFTALMSS